MAPPRDSDIPVEVGTGADEARLYDKVRALLRKAESTSFPAEAEALTAKAQDLLARYALDRALLDGDRSPGAGGGPVPLRRVRLRLKVCPCRRDGDLVERERCGRRSRDQAKRPADFVLRV